MGDAAYGDGDTRQAFADAGRTLIARVPGRPNRKHFPKEDFHIDLEAGTCTCPAGNVTGERYPEGPTLGYSHRSNRPDSPTEGLPVRWSGLRGVPAMAPVRGRGTGYRTDGATAPAGGFIAAGPGLLQIEAFGEYRQRRVVEEHRLARLVRLGIRQSRYFGRVKTGFQLYLAATVANLTLVAAKAGLPANTGGGSSIDSALRTKAIRSAFDFIPARLDPDLTGS